MTLKIYKVANFIMTFLFVGTIVMPVLMFLWLILFRMFVDFPCFVDYRQQDQCYESKNEQITRIREKEGTVPQIEVFLDQYSYMSQGGGCVYKKSESNLLEISTPAAVLKLVRSDDSLEINDQVLGSGEVLKITNVFYSWNPWTVSSVQVQNLGLVRDCDAPNEAPRIVLDGYYETDISFQKGLIISLILFGLRLFMRLVIRLFGIVDTW